MNDFNGSGEGILTQYVNSIVMKIVIFVALPNT